MWQLYYKVLFILVVFFISVTPLPSKVKRININIKIGIVLSEKCWNRVCFKIFPKFKIIIVKKIVLLLLSCKIFCLFVCLSVCFVLKCNGKCIYFSKISTFKNIYILKLTLKSLHLKTYSNTEQLNCINISQYCCFYCIFEIINLTEPKHLCTGTIVLWQPLHHLSGCCTLVVVEERHPPKTHDSKVLCVYKNTQ